jgi:hypothetical protein
VTANNNVSDLEVEAHRLNIEVDRLWREIAGKQRRLCEVREALVGLNDIGGGQAYVRVAKHADELHRARINWRG